jgi:GNAT superfamily N-acetyltransferase
MYIEILSYIQNKQKRLQSLEDIFFINAKAPVGTAEARQNLFSKYAAPYIENWPDDIFFACHLDSQKTMGYLTGCRNSRKAEEILGPKLGSYSLFSDYFLKYPAHLHMNTHPDFHGQGAGSFLIQEYIIELKKNKIRGLHIVTSPNEKNVQFYLKHKFKAIDTRTYNGRELLFMGLLF